MTENREDILEFDNGQAEPSPEEINAEEEIERTSTEAEADLSSVEPQATQVDEGEGAFEVSYEPIFQATEETVLSIAEEQIVESTAEPMPPSDDETMSTNEAEPKKETEDDFDLEAFGFTTREDTRSDRIRRARREAGIARDNERMERLRRRNEEAVQRQAEEAEQMRRGIGELYSIIPNGQQDEIVGDEEDSSTTPPQTEEDSAIVISQAEIEVGQNGSELVAVPNDEAVPEEKGEIDYTISLDATVGANLLHIGGITVAEIGMCSDGTLTVSSPDSRVISEAPTAPITTSNKGDDLTRVAPTPEAQQQPTANEDSAPQGDYDISSPYPDPTLTSEPVVEEGEEAKPTTSTKKEDAASSIDVERFDREQELSSQVKSDKDQASIGQNGKPQSSQIDTSSPYPEPPAKQDAEPQALTGGGVDEDTQKREEMQRVLREANDDERRRRTRTATTDSAADTQGATEPLPEDKPKQDSKPESGSKPKQEGKPESGSKPEPRGRTDSKPDEPKWEDYRFNKREASSKKSKQTRLDLDTLEARLLVDVLELRTKNALYEYSYMRQLEDSAAKKARIKVASELKRVERRMRPARSYEIKDNDRYYRLTLIDLASAKLPSRANRATLISLQTELVELLDRRDELNKRLLELYCGSDGGKKQHAKGRLDADISGRRAEFKRLDKMNRQISSYRISLESKKHIYVLMDRRILLSGEHERVRYILNKEKPQGEYRKSLIKEKKRIEQELKENMKELEPLVKKVLEKAKDERKTHIAMAFGWGIFLLLVIGGIGVYMSWESIMAWLSGFMPGGLN